MREANSLLDFDLDLAVQQDSQNPVYYVQYAHARICSILRALEAEGVTPRDCTAEELALLTAPEELELIQHIASYTDEIIGAAKDYDPVRITRYVIELATKFHKFYNACRVKGEEESLMQARLTLCRATATVIRNVLTMFNITVPTSSNHKLQRSRSRFRERLLLYKKTDGTSSLMPSVFSILLCANVWYYTLYSKICR